MLLGLASNSFADLDVERHAIEATLAGLSPFARRLAELWYNVRPILVELGVPSLLMGSAFPLANAVIQNAERAVGTRAGVLYLTNTAGAVWDRSLRVMPVAPVWHTGERHGSRARGQRCRFFRWH